MMKTTYYKEDLILPVTVNDPEELAVLTNNIFGGVTADDTGHSISYVQDYVRIESKGAFNFPARIITLEAYEQTIDGKPEGWLKGIVEAIQKKAAGNLDTLALHRVEFFAKEIDNLIAIASKCWDHITRLEDAVLNDCEAKTGCEEPEPEYEVIKIRAKHFLRLGRLSFAVEEKGE